MSQPPRGALANTEQRICAASDKCQPTLTRVKILSGSRLDSHSEIQLVERSLSEPVRLQVEITTVVEQMQNICAKEGYVCASHDEKRLTALLPSCRFMSPSPFPSVTPLLARPSLRAPSSCTSAPAPRTLRRYSLEPPLLSLSVLTSAPFLLPFRQQGPCISDGESGGCFKRAQAFCDLGFIRSPCSLR